MPPDGPAHFILHPVSSPLGAQKVSLLGGNSLRDTKDWGSGPVCFLLLSINGLSESSIVSFESRLGELVPKSCYSGCPRELKCGVSCSLWVSFSLHRHNWEMSVQLSWEQLVSGTKGRKCILRATNHH